ncbi:MAG TPA: GNAT family N-acetyltransferase [Caulobacteraceae bacterium]|jgi:RimJ/RimL family protein N-acetyltransferase|nr:GNAT family N-acetyltransferase [Caulobacteraceae bacterium]
MCAVQSGLRLETDRLVLRPPGAQDAVWIADRINDYDIARMTTRVPFPYSLEDARGFLDAEDDPERERRFLVEHPEFGPIGLVGFHEGSPRWSASGCALSPEIGYWFGRTFWGRGFATEAVTAALDWASTRWGRRAVASGHFTDNPASGRVLEKAGFLYTGEVQPRFSLSRGATAPTRMMVWLA